MRSIVPELTDILTKHFGDSRKISSANPYKVETFKELVEQIAKLSFANKDYLLFYRGQVVDYKNKSGSSTFYPTIYRSDYLPLRELANRFDVLEGSSKALVNLFELKKIEGYKELKRRKAIQWSILQHYEVCPTPYIDFTHSLRVACSFATMENETEKGYVYVFALPYLTNRISINSEHDIINIRLLSICPPTALRPYFQEGYLVGTDDITTNFESKNELDFNNRLVAKFEIPNTMAFWGDGFHQIPKSSLYPENDPIWKLCQEIKEAAVKELKSGDLGDFLKSWAEVEELIITTGRNQTQRFLSNREAMRTLYDSQKVGQDLLLEFEKLRVFRNTLVHTPQKISPADIKNYLFRIDDFKKAIQAKI